MPPTTHSIELAPARHRRSRGRGGFVGPFPYYSRRTRRGSRVTMSGCCLPIPLGVIAMLWVSVRLLASARAGRTRS